MAADGVRGRKTNWKVKKGMTVEEVEVIKGIVPPDESGKLATEMTGAQCIRIYGALSRKRRRLNARECSMHTKDTLRLMWGPNS